MMIWETRVISNFWSKMKVGQLEENLFLTFFGIEIFFVFSFKFLKVVCLDQIQKPYIFYKKKL